MQNYAFDKVLTNSNTSGTRELGDLGPLIHLAQTYPNLNASERDELLSRYEISVKEMRNFNKVIDNINL